MAWGAPPSISKALQGVVTTEFLNVVLDAIFISESGGDGFRPDILGGSVFAPHAFIFATRCVTDFGCAVS